MIEKNISHYKIIMGDFNLKVGHFRPNDEADIGQYGLRNRNERRNKTRLVCSNK